MAAFIFSFVAVPNPVEGQDVDVNVCSFVTLAGITLECNVSVVVMVIDTNEAGVQMICSCIQQLCNIIHVPKVILIDTYVCIVKPAIQSM